MWKRVFVLIALLAACKGSKPNKPTPPGPGSGAGSATVEVGPPQPKAPKVDDKEVLPLDPTVRHGTLPNGLTYYVKANKHPEKRVQLWLAIDAGSVLETDEQRGLAHMVEHLAFEGTKRFPKHDIQDFIERSGMKFGADLNAYTSFDETVYQLVVPSDNVDRGLDVLRDWTADISFENKEVVEERKIIEEERRFRNSAGFRMLQQIIPVRFAGSKYAQRLPIGTTEVINTATADKLLAFYKSWYRPNLEAVIVVGDVDAAAIEKAVKDKFGTVPAATTSAPPRPDAAIETAHPPRYVVARDKENTLYSVGVSYQFNHRPDATAGDYRRQLVELLFSHLLDERLDIISKRGTANWTQAGTGFETELRPVDEFALQATAKGAKIKEALGDLVAELGRVRQHGFGAEELDQGKAMILRRLEEGVKEAETHESSALADELLRNYLTHEADPGPSRELELAKAYLPTITNAELVEMAKSLAGNSRVVIVRAPTTGATPAEKDIGDAIAAGEQREMPAWQAVDLTQPLIAGEPTPGKVAAEKSLVEGVTMWTLSNGARVYLKPTTFKKDEVAIVAVSNGGTSMVSNKDYPQVRFASAIVNASGVGNYGVEELKKKLSGKKVEIETTINEEEERIGGTASPADLESLAQLVYAGFTAPRRDEGAFVAWKTQQLQFADLVAANPQGKFLLEGFGFMFDGNPRIPLPFPTKAAIEAIKLDDALAQYKARFANAADFSFVIVGAFDPAKVKPLVEKYFASLPATKGKSEVVQDVGLRLKKGTVAQTFRAGTEAKSMSLLITWATAPWSLQLEADADVLAGVLDIELLAVLREKLGGTYTVNVQSQASRNPPQQTQTLVVFESAPDNAKAMQEEAWKALEKIATSPVSDDTISKVREQIKKEHETHLGENAYWSALLARVGRSGDDLATLLDISRVTSRVTKEQVQKTARQFVDKTNRATLTLLPEK